MNCNVMTSEQENMSRWKVEHHKWAFELIEYLLELMSICELWIWHWFKCKVIITGGQAGYVYSFLICILWNLLLSINSLFYIFSTIVFDCSYLSILYFFTLVSNQKSLINHETRKSKLFLIQSTCKSIFFLLDRNLREKKNAYLNRL